MKKTDFVKEIANRTGVSIKQATAFVNASVDVITESIKGGDGIQFVGVGTIGVKERPARECVNPKTHAKIKIPAKKVPYMSFGKALKDAAAN